MISTFTLNHVHRELGSYLLLTEHLARRHSHFVGHPLKGTVSAATLPERAVVTATVQLHDHGFEVIAQLEDVVVMLRWWKSGGYVWASAGSAAQATAVFDEIAARVPVAADPRKVSVAITDETAGTHHVTLDTTPWTEIQGHYSPDVCAALSELLAHRPQTGNEAQRLVLWHGLPGTGKTSAIRALLHAWRNWADGVVVSDPHALLQNGRYLRETVLDNEAEDRWQVVVLEDAETLLHKGTGGAAMSKLLNLCDGLLGQGLRCLFLITTNEPLGAVHPALVRPGRCLARIEFGQLSASQAAGLMGRPVDRPMTLAEVMAATPVLVEQLDALAVGQYL